MEKKLFDILKERGYVKDLTHEQEIIDLVNGEPMTFYLGIDPTADSLHIGHFFALTMFRWLQDFGHHGIILIGGATALIGDPTGKSDMRKMLSKEEVAHNKAEVKELVKRLKGRGTENEEIIQGRLNIAKEELRKINEATFFNYKIINNNLDQCVAELEEKLKSVYKQIQ